MTTHLKAFNVWSFVDPGLQQGADETAKRRDHLTFTEIHQGIDYSTFGMIENVKTSTKREEKAPKSKLKYL